MEFAFQLIASIAVAATLVSCIGPVDTKVNMEIPLTDRPYGHSTSSETCLAPTSERTADQVSNAIEADEPVLGLVSQISNEIYDIVGKLRYIGVALVPVDQNTCPATTISDYARMLKMDEIDPRGYATNPIHGSYMTEMFLSPANKKETT